MSNYLVLDFKFNVPGRTSVAGMGLHVILEPRRELWGWGVAPRKEFDPRPFLRAFPEAADTSDFVWYYWDWVIAAREMLRNGATKKDFEEWTRKSGSFSLREKGHSPGQVHSKLNFPEGQLNAKSDAMALLVLIEDCTRIQPVSLGHGVFVSPEMLLIDIRRPVLDRRVVVLVELMWIPTREKIKLDLNAPMFPTRLRKWLEPRWKSYSSS